MLNTWIKIGAVFTARFPLENPFLCYIKTTLTFACDNLIPFCANACASRCTTRSLVQRWTLLWTLGCEIFLPGLAWLLLSKTGPHFSPSL